MQPVAAMALKIGHAGEFQLAGVIGLVKSVLQVGVTAHGVEGGVFIDFRTLGSDGP